MPNGDNHSGVDEAGNRIVAAGAFRCQGDHPDRAVAGGQQGVDLSGRRVAQLLRSCAPQRAALSHGPSRWIPATVPARVDSASARTAVSRSAGGAVTRLANVVVVPCRR